MAKKKPTPKKPAKRVVKVRKVIDKDELIRLAYAYCDDCIDAKQEQATGSGKIVSVKSRHIPTIDYFIRHWLRRNHFDFYTRQHFYKVYNDGEHPLSDTIKSIDHDFKALATDIVATEGKGIFYAKNKLGMTDRQQIDANQNISVINIDPLGD